MGMGGISAFRLVPKCSPRNYLRDQGQTFAERLDCFFGLCCSPEFGGAETSHNCAQGTKSLGCVHFPQMMRV